MLVKSSAGLSIYGSRQGIVTRRFIQNLFHHGLEDFRVFSCTSQAPLGNITNSYLKKAKTVLALAMSSPIISYASENNLQSSITTYDVLLQ
jgi:hypothetical protein